MELIDDEGNLLGYVNLIDALAVLLVAAVIVAGVALVTQPGPKSPDHRQQTILVSLLLTNTPPYVANAIHPGMNATSNGDVVGHITGVNRSASTIIVTDQNGTVHEADLPTKKDLTITAELVIHESNGDVTFDGKPLRIGETVELNLGRVVVKPNVTAMGPSA